MTNKKTNIEAIEQLEKVEFMFPNNQLGQAYCLPEQLRSLATAGREVTER